MTIEFTVLLPLFLMLLIFFADATIIYLTYTEMYNAAREISRRMATGELLNKSDVRAFASSHLSLGSRQYLVEVDFSGDKTAMVAVHVYDAVIFGVFFRPILGSDLVATSTTAEEPRIK